MPWLFLFLCVLLTSTSFIQAKGTKPPDNFGCRSFDKPKRIDVIIETGSKLFAGTNDKVPLLLRDSHGILCTIADLDNSGDDHERNSVDHYALCCPQDFAKTNESLSLLLLSQKQHDESGADDWFIERIEVRMKGFLLFRCRVHTWTDPTRTSVFGISKGTSSRSNNEKPSYTIIRL